MKSKICWIRCVAVLSVLLCRLAHGSAPVDMESFNRLSERDRVSFAVAALQARDQRLANISYTLKHSLGNVKAGTDTSTLALKPEFCSLRRLGDKAWMHLNRTDDDSSDTTEHVSNWIGNKSVSLTIHSRDKKPLGFIDDVDNDNFYFNGYNRILGFRAPAEGMANRRVTLAQAVEFAQASKHPAQNPQVTAANDRGRLVLKVRLPDDLRNWEYTLDVQKDFMPVRAEYLYQQEKTYNRDVSDVTDSKEINGVEVPMRVVQRCSTSAAPSVEGRYVYEVSDFSIGTVTEQDLKVDFPAGTTVVDLIVKAAFRTLPGGGVEMRPIGDPATGKVFDPRGHAVADLDLKAQTAVSTGGSATDNVPGARATASAPVMSTVPAWRFPWLIAGIVLLVFGGLMIWQRFPRRKQQDAKGGQE